MKNLQDMEKQMGMMQESMLKMLVYAYELPFNVRWSQQTPTLLFDRLMNTGVNGDEVTMDVGNGVSVSLGQYRKIELKNSYGKELTRMGEQAATIAISYFSDVLCIWAYAAQIKLDELRRQFGGQICVECHFLPLFGDVASHLDVGWGDRGGAAGYGQHVQQVAARFDHIDIHPEIWTRNRPSTSASCHLFLKAIQLLEKSTDISAAPETRFNGKSLFEEALWRCRLGFFRDLQDIAERTYQEGIAADLSLPLADIRRQIDSGAAHAALCADFDAKEKYLIQGSPTFLLDEGRQKLYGNVGYRVIEANILELLADPGERASWC